MVILSLALVVGLAGAVTASPTGKLLVRSYNGSDWDLYIMNEDGTDLQAIDVTSSNVSHGDFSPDGKTILYCAETIPGSVSIFQVPVDGGTPRIVPGCSGLSVHRPCWGNSLDHFFYGTCVGGYCGNYDMEIHKRTYTVDSEGFLNALISDQTIVIAKNVQLYDVDESLNKMTCDEVIPAACYSGNATLVTYNADGTNRTVLTSTQDGKSDACPMISPDGQYILYFKSDTGWADPHNVYRIRWDGTGQQRLTNYPGQAAYPIWRDNDTIFYPVAPNMYSIDYVLHRYTISTNDDVVITCSLPNCVPVDFFMINEPTLVAIDIKPGSCPNPLNVKDQGMLSVAVLGSQEFDVFSVDPASIRLEGVAPVRSSYEDVATLVSDKTDDCDCTTEGPDGYLDLVLKFDAQEIVAALGSVYDGDELLLILTGEDLTGTPIEGADCVVIIAKDGK